MTATTAPSVDNGVNVEALLGAREALSQAPEAAQFKWRATTTWIRGTHTKSDVKSFFGLGEEQSHRAEYSFEADHPEVFASEDKGVTCVPGVNSRSVRQVTQALNAMQYGVVGVLNDQDTARGPLDHDTHISRAADIGLAR